MLERARARVGEKPPTLPGTQLTFTAQIRAVEGRDDQKYHPSRLRAPAIAVGVLAYRRKTHD